VNLPDLQQTVLDAATLDTLFADLAAHAQVLSVVPKLASNAMVAERVITLDNARAGLRDGTLRGVQVRYRFESREWCDTLIAAPGGGARLVRICTDEVMATRSGHCFASFLPTRTAGNGVPALPSNLSAPACARGGPCAGTAA